jgi:uncharacterized protein (DUF111 family)
LVQEVNRFYPEIAPLKVGYGAGGKDFPEIPNVLRIVVGKTLDSALLQDQIAVLETNVDDVSGEIVGHAVDKLLAEGAKDVSVIPMFTKKNRPGQIIKVFADQKDTNRLSRVLIEETGTLGVRVYLCNRHIMNRESCSVEMVVGGEKELVRVKIAIDTNGRMIRIKPEYDDLKRLAEKTNRPLRELSEMAVSKAREVFIKNR